MSRKRFSLVIAIVYTLACLNSAQANWPWDRDTEKPKAVAAWGWEKACECPNGDDCTCRPGKCNCSKDGIGCKGRSGASQGGMEASEMYSVGSFGQQQCFINAQGQKQCYVNGVLVPCDQPTVQYVAAPPATGWAFPAEAAAAIDSNKCPCCGMEMTAEQKATVKAKMAAPATVAAPMTYAAAPVYMATGDCASCATGTASASDGSGRSFRTPIRTLLFRGRRGGRGCGG